MIINALLTNSCKKCKVTFWSETPKILCPKCKKRKVYICAGCKNEFEPEIDFQKYCSLRCAGLHSNNLVTKGRFTILNRDEFRCIYCGESSIEDGKNLQVDHIIARSVGGPDVAGNLITSCSDCNGQKHAANLPIETVNRLRAVVTERNIKYDIPDNLPIKVLRQSAR